MKRRDFLRTSALAGAALTLDFKGLSAALMNNTVAVEAVPDMVAVMGGEPAVMLDKALEALGGIEKYVKKGQKVVIKPNIGWDRTPELAGNTNPELVSALVKKCLAAGAEKVTVFDHTCDNWQKCYESSGIEKAAKAARTAAQAASQKPAPAKKKLSYKEQRELEQLEKDLGTLGEERARLEADLNSGTLPYEELQKASVRIGEILQETETKENRWLELSCML